MRPTAAHLPAWVLLNVTQGPFPLWYSGQITSPTRGSPSGVLRKHQPTMSYSWFGFISQTKICMFNISVLDSYPPVCHLSIEGLAPTSQRKDIFGFTTLKGDYHLTTRWCCMNNSKCPTFMGPNVFRAGACNGSLVSKLPKSSNLAGKNSYCILATGHHQCILTKYTRGLKKLYESTLSPPVPSSFTNTKAVSRRNLSGPG
jgi:hypothetical protein